MAEVLKKNSIKATMEVVKLYTQAVIIAIFGLHLAFAEDKIHARVYLWLTSLFIVLGVVFSLVYLRYGKELDVEEAKERELMR